ncbi:MAG: ribonuclease HII [Patescibacteria group bacterium]
MVYFGRVKHKPSFKIEKELVKKGYTVIGVDEVGCGCLAGPVVAAAVHLPLNSRIGGINDSKLLKAEKREELFERLTKLGVRFAVGAASPQEIDKLNIRRATLLAMQRAINAFVEVGASARESFIVSPSFFALVDAWTVPGIEIPQRGIIHGDRIVKSIAAASIIAKVVRDRLMLLWDAEYEGYFFAKHKGYGTELHRAVLKKLGQTPIHRKTFLKGTIELK